MNLRAVCATTIASVVEGQGSFNTLLPAAGSRLPERDRGLFQELCFGTLRWYPRLDAILGRLLNKPFKARDRDIGALLACALYQLRETRIPTHAAVNESVDACRELGKPWAKRLVNGVLRRYLRERDTLEAELAANPEFATAHPRWLLQALKTAWPEQWPAIIEANNSRPPMTLRVNVARISRAEYLTLLAQADIAATPVAGTDSGVLVQKPRPVEQLPGFAEGNVSVQDEAAQYAGALLGLAPGQQVLDACCAPGGKTCHMLELQPNLARLVALDADPDRLSRVAENLTRLGLRGELAAGDAGQPASWWDGVPFDRILLDAPCSATGVIRRHPDIKLLRKPADIDKLAAAQLRLLEALWPLLKTGGRLLYATCSILPRENDGVMAAFIGPRSDCRVLEPKLSAGAATSFGRQLLPEPGGHDGFYYSLIEKVSY